MKITLIIFSFYIIPIFGLPQCKKSNPPRSIKINPDFTINPIKYNNKVTSSIQVGNRIFTKDHIYAPHSSYFNNTALCPKDFIVPYKEDYQDLISYLGKNAYSSLTDINGFNMTKGKLYVTSSKGTTHEWFSFYMMYLDGEKIKIDQFSSSDYWNGELIVRCILKVPETKIEFPGVIGDINYKTDTFIKNNGEYFNGYLWKIHDDLYDSNNLTYTFNRSGTHMIEFWGNLINGEVIYACTYAYVKKKSVSSKQDYNINNVKLIETDFDMHYRRSYFFDTGNSPVAPKVDGGFYVAFSDLSNTLHILQYDKNDTLIKDFNTTILGLPHDIVETDYGFVLYARCVKGISSHLYLYNKKFELINVVHVMNNKEEDNPEVDSNMEKQLIRYTSGGSPDFGMRFMYDSDGGRLVYTKGRIFLIFAHENYFNDGYHQGDTSATFNDLLEDIDFGWSWLTSHSITFTATYDENYFISASLNDYYVCPWVNVIYTSKTEFDTSPYEYDSVNKKYNLRKHFGSSELTGKMKGYKGAFPFSRIGRIIYFEALKLYCLVYAKTPDEDKNTTVIYLTTWELKDNQIVNNKTMPVKIFPQNKNVGQVRAGKFGDDKVFIAYNETKWLGCITYQEAGYKPYVFIIKVNTFQILQNDIFIDKLYMNSNDDFQTFNDGVLIWASTNENGKLVINKIGKPRLDESFDDIDYILTQDDLKKEEEEEEKGLSGGAIFGIVIGVLVGVAILVFAIFILYKFIRKKYFNNDLNLNMKGPLILN